MGPRAVHSRVSFRGAHMKRLLLFTTLCAAGSAQAFAQNEVSQQLLELDEGDRNAFHAAARQQ
jgi:hypothetical protein